MSGHRISQDEAPFFAWAVTLGRRLNSKELDMCAALVDEKTRLSAAKIPDRVEATRHILTKLLPRLVLWNEHPTIQPNHWVYSLANGKQVVESPTLTSKVLGFDVIGEESLVCMAYCWGHKDQVSHVGVGIMQLIPVVPPHPTGRDLLRAHSHELHELERDAFTDPDLKEDVIIRRLCILLCLKFSYARAIGNFQGFDYKRLNCNIPARTIYLDGLPLTGWEFRLSMVNLGVYKNGMLVEETYQCSCATFRGGDNTTFLWDDNLDGKEKWLHFISIDMIIANLPKGASGESGSSSRHHTRGSSSSTRKSQARPVASSSGTNSGSAVPGGSSSTNAHS
ncbi:hypothetical protein M422DRAFT_31605 [Sphaerobolus stellatus SS14]|uniref:Uncharacterized protein n=1 Tax=Sphaerobolus stellatus (strain SS14) TaxID=990650 RepID=A0A0C9V580_SPHS4|nr:hypothetical protein M422DRAFT_34869 [Sphaerobolus stellatus SS14]KIJ42029.1 hypothetical protein M422DRAFT_31605 [Sphaerobolus stellatus SS14]